MATRLYEQVLENSQKLRYEELKEFLWEYSFGFYCIDNYIVYDIEEGIRVMYDELSGKVEDIMV